MTWETAPFYVLLTGGLLGVPVLAAHIGWLVAFVVWLVAVTVIGVALEAFWYLPRRERRIQQRAEERRQREKV